MPDNLFPYFGACEAQLEHELLYVHKNFGVGVGAFTCQGVEASGHQLKVVACQIGWCPATFLPKLFSIIEMRHAHEQDVFGILLPCTIGEEATSHCQCYYLVQETIVTCLSFNGLMHCTLGGTEGGRLGGPEGVGEGVYGLCHP